LRGSREFGVGRWKLGVGSWELGVGSYEWEVEFKNEFKKFKVRCSGFRNN
jgi:hypothetical protein